MNRNITRVIAGALTLGAFAAGQEQTAPANELANRLAQRLSTDLHVRTAVGEPMKAGAVTLIPIVMIDVSFGGAGIAVPPAAAQKPGMGGDGFLMSGEARPLGFVVTGKKGTRFISVGRIPAK